MPSSSALLPRRLRLAWALPLLAGLSLGGCEQPPPTNFPTPTPAALTPTSNIVDDTPTATATAPSGPTPTAPTGPTPTDPVGPTPSATVGPTPTDPLPPTPTDPVGPTPTEPPTATWPGFTPTATEAPTPTDLPTPTSAPSPTPTPGVTPLPDRDGDGAPVGQDCDDSNGAVYPGAPETCNGRDDDCDTLVDDNDPGRVGGTTWYIDQDADTWGDSNTTVTRCVAPSGYVARGGDCNDLDATYHPGATESCADPVDRNCDGAVGFTDKDGDGVAACEDCNDNDPAAYPDATEVCDAANKDEDCDGFADNSDAAADPSTKTRFYPDNDRDTYGDAAHPGGLFCDAPTNYVTNNTDCNDANAAINPGAREVCNARDDDCDAKTDDADTSLDTSTTSTFWTDGDGDTYGNAATPVKACAKPAGAVTNDDDCDDTSASIKPGGAETCNGKDDDCDTQIDDGVATTTWYADGDNDGYGKSNTTTAACSKPTGYAAQGGDCDDTKGNVNPGATEVCDASNVDENCNGLADNSDTGAAAGGKTTFYPDADRDTYGDANHAGTAFCDAPTGWVSNKTDCDDTNVDINPAAREICDGQDNNCDALTDDNDPTLDTNTASTWYKDGDEDLFGTDQTLKACVKPNRYAAENGDCDDTNAAIHPGAAEVCNGLDDDCDDTIDDGVAPRTWYTDNDADTYGTGGGVTSCEQPGGTASRAGDCNDNDRTINPGAAEICDGKDQDCDTQVDDGLTFLTYYPDADQDNHGATTGGVSACAAPPGKVTSHDDCNDAAPDVYPGATEVCNNKDDDCDTQIDENAQPSTWYADADQDTYGNPASTQVSCTQPTGYVRNGQDCNDSSAAVNPAATEACNGKDDDCDTLTDEPGATGEPTWYQDSDGDTYGNPLQTQKACNKPSGYAANNTDCNDALASVHPNATEDCNSVDDDCDGQTDEGVGTQTYYADADGDTYGNPSQPRTACVLCAGCSTNNLDCDDTNALTYPGAPERLDDKDNNCDNTVEREISITAAHRTYVGGSAAGLLGFEADLIGDFDGDGYADVGVGAPRMNNKMGGVYLIWGKASFVGEQGVDAAALRIDGTATDAEMGRAVTGGDFDADGLADLGMGAPKATTNAGVTRNGGSIALVYGRLTRPPNGTVDTLQDTFSDGYFDEVQLGFSMDGHGDINGDLIDDWAVGSPWWYVTMSPPAGGFLFVLPGKNSQYGGIVGLEGNQFIQIKGDSNQILGLNATFIDDYNGDGYGDLLGTGYGTFGSGLSKKSDVGANWIIAGRDADLLPIGGNEAQLVSDLDLGVYTGDNEDDLIGESAANLGDINGDGRPDFAVGRARRNSDEAMAFVFMGGAAAPASGKVEDKASYRIVSNTSLACPCSVGGLGDIDGDGFTDWAVASVPEGSAGRIFVFYGKSAARPGAPTNMTAETTADKIINGVAAGDKAGVSISGFGDVNGDGKDDFVVTAPNADGAAGTDVGKVYVFLGF